MSSDSISLDPPPPVSSLRSRFEKLAQQTASKPSSSTVSDSRESNGFLSAPGSQSPRQRAQSNVDVVAADNSTDVSAHLRSATSSSDLRTGKKPPPPPPSRASKAHSPSPNASPLLRPVPIPVASAYAPDSAISKPAPPPRKPAPSPPRRTGSDDSSGSGSAGGGVASIRSKFIANNSPSLPNLPSTRPTGPGARIFSQPQPPVSSLKIAQSVQSHSHRYSFSSVPLVSTLSPSPIIKLESPLLNNELEHDTHDITSPPPLPARTKQYRASPKPVIPHSRESSVDTFESSSSSADDSNPFAIESFAPAPPRRPTIVPPPRPPPRPSSIVTPITNDSPSTESSMSSPGTPTLQAPPPLPVRRSPAASMDERETSPRPPLPSRSLFSPPADPHMPPPSPAPDRKVLGSSHLPPPPTRTIALGDKLPPARRPPSGSSSDEDEEDPAHKGGRPIDLLPDASRSSRRPPIIAASPLSQFKAPVPSQTSVVAVAGHCVAVGHHNVKIYDASLSDLPRFTVELKEVATDWRVKDPKVMSMEFRHNSIDTERGCFLWVGTKEGHLWEIDVRIGVIVSTKPAAHAHAVTHIFRHGRTMITLDDSGKALVFAPDHEGPGGDVRLSGTQPRVARIADKQGFARMLGGLLWTSGGPGSGSGNGGHPNGPGPARGPLVRVYDILSSACTAKTLLPLETVGAVTSGTILPSQPSTVYLGHEGGFISLWTIAPSTSVPSCTEVIKVSASDVLCLEGVNDRLWAGSRKGMIAAYDVVQRPWVVTNCWNAHNGLPVQRLGVDPWSMEKCGKLSVVSVGRDELAKFWDGLLGVDWIDHELLKRETSFSTFRPLNVLIVSWNIDSARPETLIGAPDNINFLENTLRSVDSPDIISFGFQEVIDLENRKMAAKTVLLGGKGKNKNGVEVGGSGGANVLSEKVTRAYKMWYDRLVYAVRLAMPPDCPYTVVHAESLVGLLTCIFVKVSERAFLSDAAVASIKRGMGGRYGNKGGIISRFVIQDSSFCFINCHLAAGQHHVRTRNADVAAILDESSIFPGSEASMDASAYTGGGDGSMVLDHEFVFLNGDMNYRIDARRDAVVAAVHAGDYAQLFPHDQLLKEMRVNRGFRLRSFTEGPITFAPTYKYDRRTSEYDSSEKKRIPAWCDRVLYRSREPARVNLLHYQRYEANVSDHRPISAAFRVTIKAVDQEKRARIKEDVDELWLVHQHELLFAAREFYVTQEII